VRRLAPFAGATLVIAALVAVALYVSPAERGDADPDRPRDPAEQAAPRGLAARPVVEPSARSLLERAADAPRATSYTGTLYVTAWGPGRTTSRIVAVRHDPTAGTTWRLLGAGAGPEMRAADTPTPSLLGAGAVALIAQHYSLASLGRAGKVAGREVDLVEARRPGAAAGSLAARFWLDQATGLVLRREVYDRAGRATRASAFVDIVVRRAPAAPPEPAVNAAGALGPGQLAGLRARGWTCPRTLPGPLTLVDARRDPDSGVLRLSYADGLSSLSVFQQRGRLDEDKLRGYRTTTIADRTVWVRGELPWRAVWAEDGRVYTLLSDAPQRTVEAAVRALSRPRGDDGSGSPLDRLGRGLDRVASWFNPTD